ncbi:unnamed protein product [Phaedon cochleariae]|uniref:NADH dehydrogenase [ubiquinone] 1 beta subcomplex subunit 3 n=1 Tax=Phaedon cochleariae TaxID=80249 RepID=A0A9P0GMB7_PHACE|nr:unnamed protein product [Phaedon cochleariae]
MGGDHGHGHGHGHHEPYKIPDWRIYKVEDVPELLTTQRALASQGLKDPWLRNEVWRYDPKYWSTEKIMLKKVFFRGFRYGFAAFVLTVGGTAIYDRIYPSEHGHEEHH